MLEEKELFVLYTRPSFFEGIARLFDITGSLNKYNKSRTPEEADFRAIRSDWEAVGNEISSAARKFTEEQMPVNTDAQKQANQTPIF